jgi:biopolymer transport protein ExbB/TolQ
MVLSFVMAALMIGAFYVIALFVVPDSRITEMFCGREEKLIPFFIVFLSFWSMAGLFIKWMQLRLQRKGLLVKIWPQTENFLLTARNAGGILETIYRLVDDPYNFVLFVRVERALSNLKNIGRIADVVDMLESQAQNDEDQLESSYTVLSGFIWGIPVLGFIGTVLGLSQAIGGFGDVLASSAGLSELTEHLKGVTAGLSTAFETTLQGLVAAIIIQFMVVSLRKVEESFLDDCKEYCHANIIGRLRLIQSDQTDATFDG